jgi:Cupin domain
MKLVVAGVNEDGRSHVVSTTEYPDGEQSAQMWLAEPPFGIAPGQCATVLEPPVGGSKVGIVTFSPTDPAPDIEGFDADGFHITRTIDYDYVISGDLILALDDEQVALRPGDVAVVEGARHAWLCGGDEPACLLSVLISARSEPGLSS